MILNATKIEFRFAEEPILSGLSLKIVAGDHIALVGPNGCGKSTFIRILTGKLEADSGTVNRSQDARILTLDQIDAPAPGQSVRSYLESGLSHWRSLKLNFEQSLEALNSRPDDPIALAEFGRYETIFRLHDGYAYPARIDAALNALSLMPHADQPATLLSGGQQHRCRLARLLLTPADLWILDEPTNHLDLESISALGEGLAAFKGTCLVATHNQDLISAFATRIWALTSKGLVDYPGDYDSFRSKYGTLR